MFVDTGYINTGKQRFSPEISVDDGGAACVEVMHAGGDVAQHTKTLAPGQLTASADITF